MLIAQRRLIISDPSGDIEVPVRLFLPEEDDGMWICRYEIDWPSGREAYFAAGVDGMQALILALQVIGVEVYRSDYHKAGMLRWFEPDQGYGFPIVSSFRDVLIGDDAKEM